MGIWEEAQFRQRWSQKDWSPASENGDGPPVDGSRMSKIGQDVTFTDFVRLLLTEMNGRESATTFIDLSFLFIYIFLYMFTLYIYNFDHHCALCVPLPVNHCNWQPLTCALLSFNNHCIRQTLLVCLTLKITVTDNHYSMCALTLIKSLYCTFSLKSLCVFNLALLFITVVILLFSPITYLYKESLCVGILHRFLHCK